jgi:hypothetical protein
VISRHSEEHGGIRGTGVENHTEQLKRRKCSLSANCEEIKFFNQDNNQFFKKKKEKK